MKILFGLLKGVFSKRKEFAPTQVYLGINTTLREATVFKMFCSFLKGVYSKRKEFAPTKALRGRDTISRETSVKTGFLPPVMDLL